MLDPFFHPETIHRSVFIAPGAIITGQVTLGPESSVWFGCVLRGDVNTITIGAQCNIQDGCILHVDGDKPLRLGDRVSLGHGAIVHGCTVEDDVLIGVKSTARLFGAATGKWLALFLVLTVLLMTVAILLALLPTAGMLKLAVALAAPWAVGWHLLWQIRSLDIDDSGLCLRLFRANRDTGLIAALFLAIAAFL